MVSVPLIFASARKHGIQDDDMLHAYNHPIRVEYPEDGFMMLVGPDRAANLLEIGVVTGQPWPAIVHAMPARPRYIRR